MAVFSIFENAIHFYENNISVQKKKKKKGPENKLNLLYARYYFYNKHIFYLNFMRFTFMSVPDLRVNRFIKASKRECNFLEPCFCFGLHYFIFRQKVFNVFSNYY